MDITISAPNADAGGLTKLWAQVCSVEATIPARCLGGVLLSAHAYFGRCNSDKFTQFFRVHCSSVWHTLFRKELRIKELPLFFE